MGNTSSTVKDRYNKKTYDSMIVRTPKGLKDKFKFACSASGDSMNSVLVKAIKQYVGEK